MKIIGTILISLAAGVAILIGVGFGFTIYLSYKGARVPVYQTEISDFEFQRFTMNDKEIAEHLYTELHKLTEAHGVKKIKCFIFRSNRKWKNTFSKNACKSFKRSFCDC